MKSVKHTHPDLVLSYREGIYASVTTGFTQEYFTPFVLLLGGSSTLVGVMTSLMNVSASWVQLVSADMVRWLGTRRMLVIVFVCMQALVLLPMIACAVFAAGCAPELFALFVVLFFACGGIATPAWSSIMSDLVAQDRRGTYFGWRNKIMGFVMMIAGLVAGGILLASKHVHPAYGFVCLFSVAFLARARSFWLLRGMHEPQLTYTDDANFTLWQFIVRAKRSNFVRFVLFVSVLNFSVTLGSPFLAVLMVRDLGFDYLTYTVVIMMVPFTVYLFIERWGRIADRIGNVRILRATTPLIGLIPLLWIANQHPLYLLCVQLFSGFVWAGFNLAVSNFMYDSVTPQKRTRCISYFNVINGTAIGLGAVTGGLLVPHVPELFGFKILTVLLISAFARLAVGNFLPFNLQEVRPVEPITTSEMFLRLIGIKSLEVRS